MWSDYHPCLCFQSLHVCVGHGLDPLEWRMSSSVAGHLPDPLEVASSNEIEHGEILETQTEESKFRKRWTQLFVKAKSLFLPPLNLEWQLLRLQCYAQYPAALMAFLYRMIDAFRLTPSLHGIKPASLCPEVKTTVIKVESWTTGMEADLNDI